MMDASGADTPAMPDPSSLMRPLLLIAALALLAAGCASEPRRETPLDPRAAARLEAVTLDPAEAGRIFNAYRASQASGLLGSTPH